MKKWLFIILLLLTGFLVSCSEFNPNDDKKDDPDGEIDDGKNDDTNDKNDENDDIISDIIYPITTSDTISANGITYMLSSNDGYINIDVSNAQIDLMNLFITLKYKMSNDSEGFEIKVSGTTSNEEIITNRDAAMLVSFSSTISSPWNLTEHDVSGEATLSTLKIHEYTKDLNKLNTISIRFKGVTGSTIDLYDFKITTDGNHGLDNTILTGSENMIKIKYIETNETFSNPDRGFYNPAVIKCTPDGVSDVKESLIYRNSLIHLRIDLSSFSSKQNGSKDLELTKVMLDDLDNLFTTLNENECSVIVRFAYDNNYKGNVDSEPAISMILKHIEQFTPILNEHKNMISAVECGLVGPWGEMHSSVIANQDTYNKILDVYLKHLDKDLNLLVRRPQFIYLYYGYSLKNLSSFNYKINRLGCFNDGYLGSSSDYGTFNDRDIEIDFLSKINTNNPYGGECIKADSEYNQLSWACSEMFKTNLSYLNEHWDPDVVNRWKANSYKLNDPLYSGLTEFDYINNHLGYRLVCENLKYQSTNKLDLILKIKNVGFGEIYRNKKCFIILKSNKDQYVYDFEYNNELTISHTIDLKYVQSGDYEVYLVLADSFTDHAIRGIRFANENMYNEKLNANKLCEIKVK